MKKSMGWLFSAALALSAAMVLSNVAVAQYDDDDRYSRRGEGQQAHQYGYQSGYRDGYKKGRHEGRENDPGDVNREALREATRGYQSWMGPVEYFRDGYRDGYRSGFRAGYEAVNRGYGEGDNGTYYPNVGYSNGGYNNGRYNNDEQYGQYGNSAYQIGYNDGASVAREDAQRGKPYNASPRGRYDDMDHGYRSEYGSKGAYKSEYANGYRAGYQSAAGRY